MKFRGRFTLLFLSLLTFVIFLLGGNGQGMLFYFYAIFHACFSWVFGGWYDKLKFLSNHDPLTGVFNRRYAYKVFKRKLRSARCRNEKLGILNMDINDFKMINDSFGHSYGDHVLIEFSRVIQKCLGKSDIFVRWGGDEFLVLFSNRDKKSAEQLIDQINESLHELTCGNQKENETNITVSIGYSLFPDDANSLQELIAVADERMYKSKNN